ncbi:Cysteine-rich RLK (RECEPTOR-like protein kinase) 42 [Heracleum sosnowskyi]|uniref:Cysteine-rich RLK (RECEPTOR-like protein kinase) 42 n=1 Tax=Heracleum sosnowskyi TaxID=360622 RepID=A0AAD8NBR9_9APIA|nr:Cysteine-rich RLK (RECEPTOR-like protein kinase) 42 [Heracleum sosnowskyi]
MKYWWRMIVAVVAVELVTESVMTQQQNDPPLSSRCSYYNATNTFEFFRNLNTTLADLRREITVNKKYFGTQQQAGTTDTVYTMFQCRKYLSAADCVSCLDQAALYIGSICRSADGATVIYEGCFLWYGISASYGTTTTWEGGRCNNDTIRNSTAPNFNAAAKKVLSNLISATPKRKGYYAATTEKVQGSDTTVYAVAQCAEILSKLGCQSCLTLAYEYIKSCPPLTGAIALSVVCFMRYANTPFFGNNQTTRNSKATIGGISGGLGLILLLVALLLWYLLSRKKKEAQRGDMIGISKLKGPTIYHFKDLKSATQNFSKDSKIGEGGFGDVYKGLTKNGEVVAVKKLSLAARKAKADFESEVKLISNVNHRNIIRLLGYAFRGPELLLVLEYMVNGSLDKHLYGEKRGFLSWKQRVALILGIARGLAYLHEQSHLRIVHRDIKSSNILLDSEFQPKIADFGLARLLNQDQSHLSTRFAGTLGYTAPEYAIHGHLSEKVDTYSFGIVILEIVGGRRCTNLKRGPISCSLLEHTWNLFKSDAHLDLVDKTLDPNEFEIDNVKMIIEIALMCTQSPSSARPKMSEVVGLLTNDHRIKQKAPGKPILF